MKNMELSIDIGRNYAWSRNLGEKFQLKEDGKGHLTIELIP